MSLFRTESQRHPTGTIEGIGVELEQVDGLRNPWCGSIVNRSEGISLPLEFEYGLTILQAHFLHIGLPENTLIDVEGDEDQDEKGNNDGTPPFCAMKR